ncbi:DUF1217 domain-containing protein [Falsigemmobacter faecalis]|uniref:DUF1217 domain-containing protein n=1 Tax=Falsigemmobacter faecalis TaxID=2488730 RepID=A0A3P3D1M6_9RHOB|nr:DUF1217 domain-containing protein [Falsigemmobacter faecalis]RRH68313.1 DUF1217 domain-containing protein [Falsigemmobacter faecalis]
MSYVPALPAGAYMGWLAWQRQGAVHQKAFDNSAAQLRKEDYFRENIAKATTAEALVADRRLLDVALGAFGLSDDINSRYFIRKVLEGGTLKEGALALRLSDPRYRELAATFGYGDFSVPSTVLSDFPERLLSAWKERSLEVTLSQVNEPLRVALNAQRELSKIAEKKTTSENTKWFSIIGQPALRELFRKAFNLPVAFGALNLDRQVAILAEKSEALLGDRSPSQFGNPEKVDKLIRRYLLRADAENSGAGMTSGPIAGSTALALLTMRK